MYYDSPDRPSSFGAETTLEPLKNIFLHSSGTSDFLDSVSPTGTVKYKDSTSVNYSGGNLWKEIGTWTTVMQYQGIAKTEGSNGTNYTLQPVNASITDSVDVSAIRLKLDELWNPWQKKWSLLPENKERRFSIGRYKLSYETDARKMGKKVAQSRKPIMLASAGPLNGLLSLSTTTETLYFYHTDHLGTPILMTDTNGSKVWEGEFLPFGEPFSITSTVTNNLRFPGQYYDVETGLHYNWHRDYKPEIGRYISEDPILKVGNPNVPFLLPKLLSTPSSLHAYNYVTNNPLTFMDPLGLSKQYRCEIKKINCFDDCKKCEGGPYSECLAWCEGAGKMECDTSTKGEYPDNPYCKKCDEEKKK